MQNNLHPTHLLNLLDKMCKYEMDATRTVGATEQTQDAGRTDGQTDGRTDGRSETNIPPYNFVVRGYNNKDNNNEKEKKKSINIFIMMRSNFRYHEHENKNIHFVPNQSVTNCSRLVATNAFILMCNIIVISSNVFRVDSINCMEAGQTLSLAQTHWQPIYSHFHQNFKLWIKILYTWSPMHHHHTLHCFF